MSRVFLKSEFKLFIIVLLVINTYACVTVKKKNLYQSELRDYPTEVVVYPAEASFHQIENRSVAEAIVYPTASPFYQIEDGDEIAELIQNNADCDCESDEKSQDAILESLNNIQKELSANSFDAFFYAMYSNRLGIRLDGTEDKELIIAIDEWFGTRYKWGGCSKYGVDCSCFVKSIYRDVYGIRLNRTSRTMYYKDMTPISREELQEGDILCFKIRSRRISHVGIYLKDNKFVHSSRSKGVMINGLDEPYYKKRLFSCGRVKGMGSTRLSKMSATSSH